MTLDWLVVEGDADLARFLAVRNVVDPRPLTIAGWRAEETIAIAHLELLASLDGRDIAAGGVGWGATSADAKAAYMDAWVIPEARRQGIGGALVDRLVAFARDHGMEHGRASVVDGDAPSLAFAEARGLHVAGAGQLGDLTLTAAHSATSPALPEGVEITSLAERPDLDRAIYELDEAVRPEIPLMAAEPVSTFESWQRDLTGDPSFLPALSLIALVDGAVAGVVQIYDSAEGVIFVGMTAVDPDHRRRGIARILKNELARRAAIAGIRRIETYNDGTNDRIRALNESLGYVYQTRLLMLKGPLPEPPSD